MSSGSLKTVVIIAGTCFTLLSVFFFVQHEIALMNTHPDEVNMAGKFFLHSENTVKTVNSFLNFRHHPNVSLGHDDHLDTTSTEISEQNPGSSFANSLILSLIPESQKKYMNLSWHQAEHDLDNAIEEHPAEKEAATAVATAMMATEKAGEAAPAAASAVATTTLTAAAATQKKTEVAVESVATKEKTNPPAAAAAAAAAATVKEEPKKIETAALLVPAITPPDGASAADKELKFGQTTIQASPAALAAAAKGEYNVSMFKTAPVDVAAGEKLGPLVCDGKPVDSEIIYWKIVPGDDEFESTCTPHHDEHHDKYLTFEYDHGGWNNVRLGVECMIVVAHAMGRTLVIPPQQHLYLLGQTHKDPHDKEAHDEMGFDDFFDMEKLLSHKGLHVLHMKEFLAKEGVTGGLHGVLPPGNSTSVWGQKLWTYLDKNADVTPAWSGKYLAFPDTPQDWNLSIALKNPLVQERMKAFGGDRKTPTLYDLELQNAHHIHVPGDGQGGHRILQHHYAFAFFADPSVQSFYKRFVRDFMRYKDPIQCAGARLVDLVRKDALKTAPHDEGHYYALHIRRGDLQFKEVKISAGEIVENLHFRDGKPIIPPGSLMYVSTDDPDGVCKNCYVQRKPCDSYANESKPVGCPKDPSWSAFEQFGWKIRFMRDYMHNDEFKDVNPNTYGMVESIVCSKAKAFAGTYFSTFTGYIHRLRGYHGLGETTYYHHKNFLFNLQMKKSVGHGWSREFRAGWTDDGGGLI